MTGRYRLWPALAVAVAGFTGAAGIAVAGLGRAADGPCAAGREWVAVTPVGPPPGAPGTALADYDQRFVPALRACLDVAELPALDPAEIPDPRS